MTNHARAGRWLAAFAGGVSLIALASPVLAQGATAGDSTDQAAQPDVDSAPTGGDAQTQEAGNLGNEANESSNEVVVTATRRRQNLQDVPMSVDVASGETIQRLNIFDAKDVQQLSPGLLLTNEGGRNNMATLRGITADPDSGTDAAVDFYFNEVPLDIQTGFTSIYDVDQIEVLRGPQGALRGRTSPGGAITLRTRRANLSRIEGFAQATVTEDHGYNMQGAISVPLVTDKVAVRFSGLFDRNRGNQVRNLFDGRHSFGKTESFRVSLALKPTEDLNINLMYQYLHARSRRVSQRESFGPTDLPTGMTPGPDIDRDDYAAYYRGDNYFKNNTHLVTLNVDWDLGPVILQAVGGIQRTHLLADQDTEDFQPTSVSPQIVKSPYPVNTAEVRLLSDNEGGFFNWSVGYYHQSTGGDTSVDLVNSTFIRGFALCADVTPTPVGCFMVDPTSQSVVNTPVNVFIPIKVRTNAFAGSARFQFTEKLRLEAAARLTMSKISQTQTTTVVIDPSDPTQNLVFEGGAEISHKPLTGAANLVYEFNPNLTGYLAYGRSYRSPTVSVFGTTFISRDLLETPKETSNSFELGLKASFLEKRLSLNVAVFRQKFKDYITRLGPILTDEGDPTAPDPTAPDGDFDSEGFYNYAGDMKLYGIEATLSGRPTDNWDFTVSASWVKARWANAVLPCNDYNGDGKPDSAAVLDSNAPAIQGGGNVSYCQYNSRPSNSPDFSLVANTEYRFPLGKVEPFIRGLLNYRPSIKTVGGDKIPSRTLINLFAGIRGNEGKWELNAFVRNVLNQQRETGTPRGVGTQTTSVSGCDFTFTDCGLVGPGTSYTSGYRDISLTNPREWGITAIFRF